MPALPPPVPSIEFNLSSTGMSKGIAQTDGPQVLVRGELSFGALYFAAYGKNVTSPIEDGEGGPLIGVQLTEGGFDLGASLAWKHAINAAPGTDANAVEMSGSIGHPIGRLQPRLSIVWSPDDLGGTGRTVFAEAGASYPLGKTVTASAAVGRRHRSGGLDYTAWNAGLSWAAYKRFTVDLRYYDTDASADPDQPYRPRVVASGRLSF